MGALPAGVHTVVLLCVVNNVLRGPLEALGRLVCSCQMDADETASTQLHLPIDSQAKVLTTLRPNVLRGLRGPGAFGGDWTGAGWALEG